MIATELDDCTIRQDGGATLCLALSLFTMANISLSGTSRSLGQLLTFLLIMETFVNNSV